MASVLSHRLRRLEGKLRPDGIQYIIVAPPSIQTRRNGLREYAPQYKEWREERRKRMGPTGK